MEKDNRLPVDGFLFLITSQDSVLHLEAEEKSTGKILIISLDSDAIVQVTNGLFNNAEDMVQGLKDAVSGNCPELRLTINPQGKLTYTAIFSAGRMKKEDRFSLNLTEKPVEPDEALNRKFKAIDRWKDGHEAKMDRLEQTLQYFQGKTEEKFNKLENMMLQMEQRIIHRLDALEKVNKAPQVPYLQENHSYFNADSVNSFSYAFSNDNRTIKLLSGFHPCLELLPQIPQKGRHSYSLKINAQTKPFCFGITTERKKQNWNGDLCNYRYETQEGRLYGKVDKKSTVEGPFGGTGKIVKMVVDMDKGILTFFVENKKINSCDISTSDSYFAYVSFEVAGESVTLVEDRVIL